MGYVVGLTGGIGSGKSAVSDCFKRRGVTIADADVAARTVVEPGTPALASITEHFGTGVLRPDGALDRAALRNIVFRSVDDRRWLESVTVPAIMSELKDILAKSTAAYSMLILSSGSGRSNLIDRSLVVDVPEEVQIARVTSRDNNSVAQVRAIMNSQPTREQRLAYADDVITNTGNLTELEALVDELHAKYLALAKHHG